VIGKKTAKELESHGSEGAAVAQLAAESAPEPVSEPASGESQSSGGKGNGKKDGGGGKASGGGNGTPGGGQAAANRGGAQGATQSGDGATAEAAGSGSSGVSEVLGQATGASSGQMGVFLPLVLLAALILALVYAWRRRHHEPETLS
jgi:hypothetical protein